MCSKGAMHWHAQAVTCLKATEDGGYLLSAGHEGVLVMWQVAIFSQLCVCVCVSVSVCVYAYIRVYIHI